ncbi:MAG: flagellar M-ring protein FliF, partial [Caulobacter sp. 35-67-4]
MSAAGWIDAFLEMMAVERAAARNTLKAYGKDLEDARLYLAGTGGDLDTASTETIEAYFQDLGVRGLSPATAARRRSAVRQFYRFVLEEGWRADDPSRRVAAPKAVRPLPKVLSRDEVDRLIAAAAFAWMMIASPTQKTLFAGLADADKASVTAALQQANITSKIDEGTGALTVAEEDYSRARILLAGQGLPKASPAGYQILDNLPMGVSRAVEGERLRQARETELARSIQEIDAVAEARVHLATPEQSVFVRDNAAPSASVIVKLQPGRSLGDAQVSSIVNLVASSVPGMKPEGVTIVDQMGGLL